MCIILSHIATSNHDDPPNNPYLVIIAANRDEYFQRPTLDVQWHTFESLTDEHSGSSSSSSSSNTRVLSGRDGKDPVGGTWFGLSLPAPSPTNSPHSTSSTQSQPPILRLGFLTNIHDSSPSTSSAVTPTPEIKRSRGGILKDYLSLSQNAGTDKLYKHEHEGTDEPFRANDGAPGKTSLLSPMKDGERGTEEFLIDLKEESARGMYEGFGLGLIDLVCDGQDEGEGSGSGEGRREGENKGNKQGKIKVRPWYYSNRGDRGQGQLGSGSQDPSGSTSGSRSRSEFLISCEISHLPIASSTPTQPLHNCPPGQLFGSSNSPLDQPLPKVIEGCGLLKDLIARRFRSSEEDSDKEEGERAGEDGLIEELFGMLGTNHGPISSFADLHQSVYIPPLYMPIDCAPAPTSTSSGPADHSNSTTTSSLPPKAGGYGTRLSTVVLVTKDGKVTFIERDREGREDKVGERRFGFDLFGKAPEEPK